MSTLKLNKHHPKKAVQARREVSIVDKITSKALEEGVQRAAYCPTTLGLVEHALPLLVLHLERCGNEVVQQHSHRNLFTTGTTALFESNLNIHF